MDAQSFLEDNQNNESDMDLEETLALKRTNYEKLIRNMDKAIRNEKQNSTSACRANVSTSTR